MKSVYARHNALIRNLKDRSEEVKVLLFKIYCTGFYCSSLWYKYRCKTYTQVKSAYNNFFRLLMDHDEICVSKTMIDNNINPFNAVMRKYIAGFIKQLDNCEDVIVKTLYNWLGFQNSELFRI